MLKKILSVLAFSLAIAAPAIAFEPKDRPITIISGFTPGATDQALRPYIEVLESKGYKVNIEHRPGANGSIAMNHFANKANPDGYTLWATASSLLTIAPIATPELVQNNGVDLITTVAAGPMVLISTKESGIKTIEDFRKDLSSDRKDINVATPSLFFEVAARYLVNQVSKDNKSVPTVSYKSGADAIRDILGNHVRYGVLQLAVAAPFIDSDKINIIAISGTHRFPSMLHVPTFSEKIKGFHPKVEASWGLALPKGTASEIHKFYHDTITSIARKTETKARLQTNFMIIPENYIGKQAFEKRIAEETVLWKEILVNIKK
jgi:tripartite-type tricarboxylate transporter receptor subunit TctC